MKGCRRKEKEERKRSCSHGSSLYLSSRTTTSVAGEGSANTCPQLRLGAHAAPSTRGIIIEALTAAAGIAGLANVDVASAANTAVASRLVAGSGAGAEFVVERERGAFVGSVDVACAANAREEAATGGR